MTQSEIKLLYAQVNSHFLFNALKHGTSQLLGPGVITLSARCEGPRLLICIEDNAGLFPAHRVSNGLGMQLIDKRLQGRYGAGSVECQPDRYTRITLFG